MVLAFSALAIAGSNPASDAFFTVTGSLALPLIRSRGGLPLCLFCLFYSVLFDSVNSILFELFILFYLNSLFYLESNGPLPVLFLFICTILYLSVPGFELVISGS